MLRKAYFALLFLVVAFICNRAMSQATVVGGQGTFIYVDGSSGSDSNPGSSTQPLQTIQAGVNIALANKKAGIATVVSIAPGTYRETLTMNNATAAPVITVQAATTGSVFVDGNDPLNGGEPNSSGVYTYFWTDSVGGCPLPTNWYTGMPPVVQANEMVFINGAPLNQVMSHSLLVPGAFYVNFSAGQVEVDPPAGTNMTTADVEVSARRSTLSVHNVSNVVFNGLVFQHAASCMNVDGASINSSSNVLVENVKAEWNNWGGFGVNNSQFITVQNSVGNYNGGVGFHGVEVLNSLFFSNESDYNNWRGEMVGLYDYASGGTKLMHTRSVTVSNQRSFNNGAQGLWFDTDNIGVTIKNASLVGNLISNLQIEANQGPITVENSSLCYGGTGVNMLESEYVTLSGNHFYGNGSTINGQNAQLFIAGKPFGRVITNFQTGQSVLLVDSNTTLEGNTFTAIGSQQFTFNTYLAGSDWSAFIFSLQSSNNEWYDSSNANAFGLTGNQHVSFAGWQAAADDMSSSWQLGADAQGNCTVPKYAYDDFKILAHNASSYVSQYVMSSKGTVTIPLQILSFAFGTVNLAVHGLPSGVTASFSKPSLVSGNSALTLTADDSAINQTIPVTIYATSGNRVHTITVWVVVQTTSSCYYC